MEIMKSESFMAYFEKISRSLLVILIGLMFLSVNYGKVAFAASSTPSPKPTIISTLNGVNNKLLSPPSPTIASNKTEQIELVNGSFLIHTNTGTTTTGTIASLINTPNTFTGDPQIIWDAGSNRFYYSFYEFINNNGVAQPGIAWGFSKGANPSSATAFCHYFNSFDYGTTTYPDRQNLGDTADFLLISSNRYFLNNNLDGSDLAWISKPAAGTTCPTASSFKTGIKSLKNPDGVTSPWLPASAKQVDSSSTGWVLGDPSYVSGSSITAYNVTKDSVTGNAVISAPSSIPIPAYSMTKYAPQAGTTTTGIAAKPLETQTYLTQVISSFDARLGHNTLWTAQTNSGGAGVKVDWYEINPVSLVLDQFGSVSDPNLYIFNPTISSDRLVVGTTKKFGDSAILNVNTSSINAYPAVQVVSMLSGQPQSSLTMVKQSTGPNIDFTCSNTSSTDCRWGDYSGAVPNPAASTKGTHGQVIISNQWNVPNIDDNTTVWQTLFGTIGF